MKQINGDVQLSRQQKRIMDRINKEASIIFNVLADQFVDLFMESDVDSEEVTKKQKEISSKWKIYCSKKGLTADSFKLVDDFCNEFRDDYKKEYDKT